MRIADRGPNRSITFLPDLNAPQHAEERQAHEAPRAWLGVDDWVGRAILSGTMNEEAQRAFLSRHSKQV